MIYASINRHKFNKPSNGFTSKGRAMQEAAPFLSSLEWDFSTLDLSPKVSKWHIKGVTTDTSPHCIEAVGTQWKDALGSPTCQHHGISVIPTEQAMGCCSAFLGSGGTQKAISRKRDASSI